MSETKDMCYRCRNFTQYYLKKTDGSFRRAYYGRCRVLYVPVHVYFGACEFFEAKSQENRSDEIQDLRCGACAANGICIAAQKIRKSL